MSGNLKSRFNITKQNIDNNSDDNSISEQVINTNEEQIYIKDNITSNLKSTLLNKIEHIPVWFDYTKEQQTQLIKRFIDNELKTNNIIIHDFEKDEIFNFLISSLQNFAGIQNFIDNEKVDTIMINGTNSIYIEIAGKKFDTDTNLDKNQLVYLLNSIKNMAGYKNFNQIERLKINNLCITIISDDISLSGINIFIKKVRKIDNNSLIENQIMPSEIFDFILYCISKRKNIIISGDTNTYKTSFLDLIISNFTSKQIYLMENDAQIYSDSKNITKFIIRHDSEYFDDITSEIIKIAPQYLITDFNKFNPQLLQSEGSIQTVKSNSVENTLKQIISAYVNNGDIEKFAKSKALKNVDYIIQFEKSESGAIILKDVVELKPAKTIQTSLKSIYKHI